MWTGNLIHYEILKRFTRAFKIGMSEFRCPFEKKLLVQYSKFLKKLIGIPITEVFYTKLIE